MSRSGATSVGSRQYPCPVVRGRPKGHGPTDHEAAWVGRVPGETAALVVRAGCSPSSRSSPRSPGASECSGSDAHVECAPAWSDSVFPRVIGLVGIRSSTGEVSRAAQVQYPGWGSSWARHLPPDIVSDNWNCRYSSRDRPPRYWHQSPRRSWSKSFEEAWCMYSIGHPRTRGGDVQIRGTQQRGHPSTQGMNNLKIAKFQNHLRT